MECANCGKKCPEMSFCSACEAVHYCGRECQVAHWKTHKTDCKHLKKTAENPECPEPEPKPKPEKETLLHQLGYCDEIEEAERKKHEEYLKNPIHNYEVLEEIGTGNFTSIHKALEKASGKTWAIKIAEKKVLIRKHKERDLLVEKHCLTKAKGIECVVQIEKTFQDDLHLYIVMELVEGKELWELINVFGFLDKRRAYFFFNQILRGVEQLHKIGIVHRDLKPENVIVRTADEKVKLIDFGSSKDIFENVASQGNSSTGRKYFEHFMGTPNYMAPECIHNRFSDFRSDIYSLGCFFYNLVVGFPPFLGGSEYLIFKAALDKQTVFYDFLFDPQEIEMLGRILEHDADKRPTIAELCQFFEKHEKEIVVDEAVLNYIGDVVREIRDLKPADTAAVDEFFVKCHSRIPETFVEAQLEATARRLTLLKSQALQFWKIKSFEHRRVE